MIAKEKLRLSLFADDMILPRKSQATKKAVRTDM